MVEDSRVNVEGRVTKYMLITHYTLPVIQSLLKGGGGYARKSQLKIKNKECVLTVTAPCLSLYNLRKCIQVYVFLAQGAVSSPHPPVAAAKAGRNNMSKQKTYPSPSLLQTILNYMTTVYMPN